VTVESKIFHYEKSEGELQSYEKNPPVQRRHSPFRPKFNISLLVDQSPRIWVNFGQVCLFETFSSRRISSGDGTHEIGVYIWKREKSLSGGKI
jgi:hypothetical protein